MSVPPKSNPLDSLDWLSFPSPGVVEAPHPDLFEYELDNSLSQFDQGQVQLLELEYSDSFAFFRSQTPHGPPSTITVSSESAYETLSSYSESAYNYPLSEPYQAAVDPTFPPELALQFGKFNVETDNISNHGLPPMTNARDSSSYPSVGAAYEQAVVNASYDLGGVSGPDGTLYPTASANYLPASSTVAPGSISNGRVPGSKESPVSSSDGSLLRTPDSDPRKKYPCPHCTRSFARAYNLKTHLATHDPNRLKPYVCSHRSCGRSFSRKHDLGRHLVSIHRDESGNAYTASHNSDEETSSTKGVGISDKASRTWCDDCGRGFVGRQASCNCARDVK